MATDVRFALYLYLKMYSVMKIANFSVDAQSDDYILWCVI